ncbi:T9SS type A sorting domain-containing protein [candidate division KSB1 bacterium]|nr:T9SS type A sorting domain-containing protein [candidate division KSB1 bacterium]
MKKIIISSMMLICTLVINKVFIPTYAYTQYETKLTANDGSDFDRFGWVVAIGDYYAAVGAPGADSQKGAVYIYKRHGTNWIEEIKLSAPDGTRDDNFGCSVSIHGHCLAIGADHDIVDSNYCGSVYLFERIGDTWVQTDNLFSTVLACDFFGISVSIDADYLIIGASYDEKKGAAYIYNYDGNTWIEQAKLIADDGELNDDFGYSVSINGSYAVVGAESNDDKGDMSGSAYVFKRNGTSWDMQSKLLASDGDADDGFGFSVDIDEDYLVVGAPGDAEAKGAAYVFKSDGATWTEQAKLTASDCVTGDFFGASVSIEDTCIVIGSSSNEEKGAVYIFNQDAANWVEITKIVTSDGSAGDHFGYGIAANKRTILVGAYGDRDHGYDTGAAYVYHFINPPEIISVNDVDNDQGGRVTIKWKASSLDNDIDTLSYYNIWRASSNSMNSNPLTQNFANEYSKSSESASHVNTGEYSWERIARQPAHCFPVYSYSATTLCDSTSATDGMHYFMVSASTNCSPLYKDSNVDSGYSVDNCAPIAPSGLILSLIDNQVQLTWEKSEEPDLAYYVVYRNGISYDTTVEETYIDDEVENDMVYTYSITAVDIHENESEFSEQVSTSWTWVHAKQLNRPETYQLFQNYPNPFNNETLIRYQLANSCHIELVIYNINGQSVRSLLNKYSPAGSYHAMWNGKNDEGFQANSGIYLYQMKITDHKPDSKSHFIMSQKLLLLR